VDTSICSFRRHQMSGCCTKMNGKYCLEGHTSLEHDPLLKIVQFNFMYYNKALTESPSLETRPSSWEDFVQATRTMAASYISVFGTFKSSFTSTFRISVLLRKGEVKSKQRRSEIHELTFAVLVFLR
jgi:hypothetical protein